MVERAVRHSTTEVYQALFADSASVKSPAKTLTDLKQGIRQHMQRRHAGHLPLATFDRALAKLSGVQKL